MFLIGFVIIFQYLFITIYLEGSKSKKMLLMHLIFYTVSGFFLCLLVYYVFADYPVISNMFWHSLVVIIYIITYQKSVMDGFVFITVFFFVSLPGNLLAIIINETLDKGKDLLPMIVYYDVNIVYLVAPIITTILLLRLMILKSIFQQGPVEKQVFIFSGITMSIYVYIFMFIVFNAKNMKEQSLLLVVVLAGLVGVNYFFLKIFAKKLSIQKSYDRYGDYSLSMEPILRIISHKEMLLYNKTTELKEKVPMEQEVFDNYIEDIKSECFIQISFTENDLINAMLFKYYILLQSYHIELITFIPRKIGNASVEMEDIYNVLTYWFDLIEGILKCEVCYKPFEAVAMKKNEITIDVFSQRKGFNFNGRFNGNMIDHTKIGEHIQEIREQIKIKYSLSKKFQFLLSPESVELNVDF